MSKQAFDRLMSQLPEADKKTIYAMAAAYGLAFDSPEWIPFAISQHGLLAIQHAIAELGTAVREGSDHAISEAMKTIRTARDAEVSHLKQAAAEAGSGLTKTAAEGRQSLEAQAVKMTAQMAAQLTRTLQDAAKDIVACQVGPLNTAAVQINVAAQWLGVKAVAVAAGCVGVVALAAWGLVAWEQRQVDDLFLREAMLRTQLTQEQATVADLDTRGGRIKMNTCGPANRLCVELAPNQGNGLPVPYPGPWENKGNKHQYAIPKGY